MRFDCDTLLFLPAGSTPLARKGLVSTDSGGLEAIIAAAKKRKASGQSDGEEFSIDLSKLSLEQLEQLREKAREKQWEDEWWASYVKQEEEKKVTQDKEVAQKDKATISQYNMTLTRWGGVGWFPGCSEVVFVEGRGTQKQWGTRGHHCATKCGCRDGCWVCWSRLVAASTLERPHTRLTTRATAAAAAVRAVPRRATKECVCFLCVYPACLFHTGRTCTSWQRTATCL